MFHDLYIDDRAARDEQPWKRFLRLRDYEQPGTTSCFIMNGTGEPGIALESRRKGMVGGGFSVLLIWKKALRSE